MDIHNFRRYVNEFKGFHETEEEPVRRKVPIQKKEVREE